MKQNVDRSRSFASFFLMAALAGCSSGAGIPFAASAPGMAPAMGSDVITHHGVRAKTLYVADAAEVGSPNKGIIFSFAATAKGDPAPATAVTGSSTGLAGPYFVAAGKSNRTWAAGCPNPTGGAATGGSVVSFLPKATGNATPAVTISGSATTLSQCLMGIAVDSKGNVYVADQRNNAVDVFAAGSNGNIAPSRQISGASTGLESPGGIAVGSTGLIYVANSCTATHCAGSVAIFGATATGNVAPTTTISGAATKMDVPEGVCLDSAGDIYVTNNTNGVVTEFPKTAKGNAKPTRYWSGGKTKLAFPTGCAVDGAGYIYVGNTNTFYTTNYPVMVFAPETKTGQIDVAPVSSITPKNSASNEPSGIAVFPPIL